jgi:hypothetical protein
LRLYSQSGLVGVARGQSPHQLRHTLPAYAKISAAPELPPLDDQNLVQVEGAPAAPELPQLAQGFDQRCPARYLAERAGGRGYDACIEPPSVFTCCVSLEVCWEAREGACKTPGKQTAPESMGRSQVTIRVSYVFMSVGVVWWVSALELNGRLSCFSTVR